MNKRPEWETHEEAEVARQQYAQNFSDQVNDPEMKAIFLAAHEVITLEEGKFGVALKEGETPFIFVPQPAQ